MSTIGSNWLNYHHLYYFWRVAREGSLSRAAEQLRLSHSTLSTQIRALEESLQGELFLRSGRALSLTVLGRDILQYADEIFRLGNELSETVTGKSAASRRCLRIGIVCGIPSVLVYRLAEPVLGQSEQGPLHVQQGRLDELLDHMAAGHLHLILSEQAPPQGLSLHVYSHTVGESTISLYGTPAVAQQYKADFPRSLAGAPLLLPGRGTSLRRRVDEWLATQEIAVRVVAELDDSEALRTFAAQGHGLFPVHTALAWDLEDRLRLHRVGELAGVHERFYLLSPLRRSHRTDVQKIVLHARQRLLSSG
ncbi:MAG: LysR family transcriptional regulator [Myxococcales bacterium]|nr:LysR family transcriptional regulator [Myxococcales bacterium]